MRSNTMRKAMQLLILICTLVSFPISVIGQAPQSTCIQGYLETSTGGQVTGNVNFGVAIYDAALGGNQVWPSIGQHIMDAVPVENGLFAMCFGDAALAPDKFGTFGIGAQSRWVQISTRPTDLDPWEDMVPRVELRATPYAFRAGDSSTLDGATRTELEESVEIDSKIEIHRSNPSAHHARYTDAEAVAAVQAAGIGVAPHVEFFHVTFLPFASYSAGVWENVPGSSRTVTLPSGLAIIMWSIGADSTAPTANGATAEFRPYIGTLAPSEGFQVAYTGKSFVSPSGSWSTQVNSGQVEIGIQIRNEAVPAVTQTGSRSVQWTVLVFPTILQSNRNMFPFLVNPARCDE